MMKKKNKNKNKNTMQFAKKCNKSEPYQKRKKRYGSSITLD
jgi:hypothetical protein